MVMVFHSVFYSTKMKKISMRILLEKRTSNYKSIHKQGRDEIIIKKSRFIGTSSPVETEEEA